MDDTLANEVVETGQRFVDKISRLASYAQAAPLEGGHGSECERHAANAISSIRGVLETGANSATAEGHEGKASVYRAALNQFGERPITVESRHPTAPSFRPKPGAAAKVDWQRVHKAALTCPNRSAFAAMMQADYPGA